MLQFEAVLTIVVMAAWLLVLATLYRRFRGQAVERLHAGLAAAAFALGLLAAIPGLLHTVAVAGSAVNNHKPEIADWIADALRDSQAAKAHNSRLGITPHESPWGGRCDVGPAATPERALAARVLAPARSSGWHRPPCRSSGTATRRALASHRESADAARAAAFRDGFPALVG